MASMALCRHGLRWAQRDSTSLWFSFLSSSCSCVLVHLSFCAGGRALSLQRKEALRQADLRLPLEERHFFMSEGFVSKNRRFIRSCQIWLPFPDPPDLCENTIVPFLNRKTIVLEMLFKGLSIGDVISLLIMNVVTLKQNKEMM